jgi:hypothetical protein
MFHQAPAYHAKLRLQQVAACQDIFLSEAEQHKSGFSGTYYSHKNPVLLGHAV